MKVDSIDRWRTETRWSTNAIELRSWDYRAVNDRPVSAVDAGDAPLLTSRDTPGAYAYSSREQGQRIAERQVEALAAARQQHVAAGTVRTLSPGTTFTLHGHAQFDGETFAIVRAVHLMHNNLSADLLGGVIKLLGQGAVAAAGDKDSICTRWWVPTTSACMQWAPPWASGRCTATASTCCPTACRTAAAA